MAAPGELRGCASPVSGNYLRSARPSTPKSTLREGTSSVQFAARRRPSVRLPPPLTDTVFAAPAIRGSKRRSNNDPDRIALSKIGETFHLPQEGPASPSGDGSAEIEKPVRDFTNARSDALTAPFAVTS